MVCYHPETENSAYLGVQLCYLCLTFQLEFVWVENEKENLENENCLFFLN